MSPRRIKMTAPGEGREEPPEHSDTPEDQARVTRQKQPSVDAAQRLQVAPKPRPEGFLSEARLLQQSWFTLSDHKVSLECHSAVFCLETRRLNLPTTEL